LPRGRFLGGSSGRSLTSIAIYELFIDSNGHFVGSNGTICVRGVPQDYDDWGFPEWSGAEMFRAMKKVRPMFAVRHKASNVRF